MNQYKPMISGLKCESWWDIDTHAACHAIRDVLGVLEHQTLSLGDVNAGCVASRAHAHIVTER